MTNNKKRMVYESIMKELSKKVKYLIENIDNEPIKEITNIQSLTREDYDDPMMNTSFYEFNNRQFKIADDKIGFDVNISDDDDKTESFTIWGNSLGNALYKLIVITFASFESNVFYRVESSKVIDAFRKHFVKILDDDTNDEIENEVSVFSKKLSDVTSIEQIADVILKYIND